MSNHHDGNNHLTIAAEQQKFDTPEEEIAHLKHKLEECQTDFQEFQESSRELEVECETQIKQLETKNNESLNQIRRLEDENEQLRSKYNAYTSDTQHKLNEYQIQIGELTSINDRLTAYIRELEQSNDDLERARRALAASLEDFESQLNQQIERNVLLENEVSEKEELECVVQRLKEETRDLRHELIVNKNSSESAKRKMMMAESSSKPPTPSQNSDNSQTSLASTTRSSDLVVENIANKLGRTSLNGSFSPQTPEISPATANNDKKLANVDSTTSPTTQQNQGSRFSFSSPFSYNRSSLSTDSKSQQTSTPSSPTMPSIVMSPSSRISALNIVSDLLRKVGALESKLASAKKVVG